MGNADLIRELTRRWNAGELEGALELYADDAEMRTGSHWPEDTVYRGLEEIRATTEDWASTWERVRIELESLEEHGDKIVVTGAWVMRGAASGVDGEMDIFIVFTVRDGKIAVLEWFPDHDSAVAAARGA
jgi:ketosteroid isomerase-like protein